MDIVEIVRRLGGATRAAGKLSEKRSTISMWLVYGRLPLQHVPKVAVALDVPACEVWPELAVCKPPPADPTGSRRQLPLFPQEGRAA